MRKLAASVVFIVSISVICLGESKLIQVPICRQATDYTCGVASMQSVLGYYGMDQTRGDQRQDQLAKALKSTRGGGTSYKNMVAYASKKLNLDCEVKTGMTLDDLKGYIDIEQPVIVLIQAWNHDENHEYTLDDAKDGHYVVAVGYDTDKDWWLFMDPVILGRYAYLTTKELEARWHDKDKRETLVHFGLIIKGTPNYDPSKPLPIK